METVAAVAFYPIGLIISIGATFGAVLLTIPVMWVAFNILAAVAWVILRLMGMDPRGPTEEARKDP